MKVGVYSQGFALVSLAPGSCPPLWAGAVISACVTLYVTPAMPLTLGLSLLSSGTQDQGGLTSP